jgi:hypothetical protein
MSQTCEYEGRRSLAARGVFFVRLKVMVRLTMVSVSMILNQSLISLDVRIRESLCLKKAL